MELRNKKTGEITNSKDVLTDEFIKDLFNKDFNYFISKLDKLQEEWEGYEEMGGYWFINEFGTPSEITHARENIYDKSRKNFGNYFETKEEAEKAVEKLKAWKRLKDKGFRFNGGDDCCISYTTDIEEWNMQDLQDFKILFGGEQ